MHILNYKFYFLITLYIYKSFLENVNRRKTFLTLHVVRISAGLKCSGMPQELETDNLEELLEKDPRHSTRELYKF